MSTTVTMQTDGFRKGDIIRVESDRQYAVAADGGIVWSWLQESRLYKVTSVTETTLDVVEYRGDRQILTRLVVLVIAKFATLANLAFVSSFAL